MKQSFLNNDRIYLRAVEPEDLDVMYEMENDPSMWDISNFTVPYSRYVCWGRLISLILYLFMLVAR